MVVVVEFPESGRGCAVLDSGGVGTAGTATVVIVTIEGEMGSATIGTSMTECMVAGSRDGCSSQS